MFVLVFFQKYSYDHYITFLFMNDIITIRMFSKLLVDELYKFIDRLSNSYRKWLLLIVPGRHEIVL